MSALTLTKITGTIAAGTPVVIRRSASVTSVDITRSGTDKADSPVTGSSSGGLTLTGTFTQADITSQNGYIIANNSFWNISTLASSSMTPKVYCNPFRAYLAGTITSGAKELVIGLGDDTPTAVEALNAITSGTAAGAEPVEVYDLAGHRLSDLQRGVNIVKFPDGTTKKIIIK